MKLLHIALKNNDTEIYINEDNIISIKCYFDKNEYNRIKENKLEGYKSKLKELVVDLSNKNPMITIMYNGKKGLWSPEIDYNAGVKNEFENDNYTELIDIYYDTLNDIAKNQLQKEKEYDVNLNKDDYMKYEIEMLNNTIYTITKQSYEHIIETG